MKRIFIGSSTEAKEQAANVANLLRKIPGIEPVLWYEYFAVGDITFIGIEALADTIHGAVLLATPDDDSVIRSKAGKTPRANVLFEYGFLTAFLGRKRVALCRYLPTVLPSDFDGLTYVVMGDFDPRASLSHDCNSRLTVWAQSLPTAPLGMGATQLRHSLSGTWNYELQYSLWRKLPINGDDYAVVEAKLHLDIPSDGNNGTGCALGRLQVQKGDCYAEFRVSDVVKEILCTPTGGLRIKSETHSRQLASPIQGTPPQSDGYEQTLKAAQSFVLACEPDPHKPSTLIGDYQTTFAGKIYSEAKLRVWR